ncbi:hypothetical protein M433DRAFT_23427 [Acidomyces richmondensis BFW]|nr:hypothetical protein M433DRAFT_23427 [Acidomyces richmondensis BFW]
MEMRVVIKGHGVDKYPAKSHAQRVVDKLGIESGTIILAATPMKLYSNSDQPMPFRQDRYFYYLTGSNEPGCLVTYDIARNHLTLLLPAIDESRVVWTGRGSTVEEAMEKYDIDEAQYLPKDISAPLTHVLMHDDCCRCCLPKLWLDNQAEGLFDRSGEGRAMQARLREAFDSCRVIKDEHEIGLIRKANEITAEAHRTVLLGLHRFRNESHVDAAYTAACIAKHAKEQSYKPIAGAGSNASVLHYDRNDADFGDSQVMVLDAGCEWHCYASDVTRSFPLNAKNPGHWQSEEAKNIYKLVEACIGQMRPGNYFIQIARLSQSMMMAGLLNLGILKGNPRDIWKAGTVSGFFPHGLGHHIGLEVHDVSPPPRPTSTRAHSGNVGQPDPEDGLHGPPFPLPLGFRYTSSSLYSTDAADSKLEPGMVITIEPGCYFNKFLLEKFFLSDPVHGRFIDKEVLSRYMKVGGVRIEDDILITRDGSENLTTAPKGERMLEIIREGSATRSPFIS